MDGGLRGAEGVGLRVEGVQDVEVVGEVGEVGVDGLIEGEVEGKGGGWVGRVGRVEGGGVHSERLRCPPNIYVHFADQLKTTKQACKNRGSFDRFGLPVNLSQLVFRSEYRLDHCICGDKGLRIFRTVQGRVRLNS